MAGDNLATGVGVVTVEQLVKAFQELRRDRGITVAKLQNRPDLLAAFKCDNGQAFIDFLEEATIAMSDDPKVKAALVALAVGYEPLKDLKTRRLHNAGVASEQFGDVQQNIRRHEDEGFKEIATHLLEVNQKMIDGRNISDRVDQLEQAVTLLMAVARELLLDSDVELDRSSILAKFDKFADVLKRPVRKGEVPVFGDYMVIRRPAKFSNSSQPVEDGKVPTFGDEVIITMPSSE